MFQHLLLNTTLHAQSQHRRLTRRIISTILLFYRNHTSHLGPLPILLTPATSRQSHLHALLESPIPRPSIYSLLSTQIVPRLRIVETFHRFLISSHLSISITSLEARLGVPYLIIRFTAGCTDKVTYIVKSLTTHPQKCPVNSLFSPILSLVPSVVFTLPAQVQGCVLSRVSTIMIPEHSLRNCYHAFTKPCTQECI